MCEGGRKKRRKKKGKMEERKEEVEEEGGEKGLSLKKKEKPGESQLRSRRGGMSYRPRHKRGGEGRSDPGKMGRVDLSGGAKVSNEECEHAGLRLKKGSILG